MKWSARRRWHTWTLPASPNRNWVHVTVADRRHRDHGPPEGLGDAGEGCVLVVHLGEVDGAGEEDDSAEEEEDEQGQLPQAGLQRLAQDLQALLVESHIVIFIYRYPDMFGVLCLLL